VFGEGQENYFYRGIERFLRQGLVHKEGSKYFLTDEGKLFADGIAADLFSEE
jgi:hypothetical protein